MGKKSRSAAADSDEISEDQWFRKPKKDICVTVSGVKGNKGKSVHARGMFNSDIEPYLVFRAVAQRRRGRQSHVHEATYFRVRLYRRRMTDDYRLKLYVVAWLSRKKNWSGNKRDPIFPISSERFLSVFLTPGF